MAFGWQSLLSQTPDFNNNNVYKAFLEARREGQESRKRAWDLYKDQKMEAIIGDNRKPDGSPDWEAIGNASQKAGLGQTAFAWTRAAQKALNEGEVDTVQKRAILDMYGVPQDLFDQKRGDYETKVERREIPGTGMSTNSGIRPGTRMSGETGHIPTAADYDGLSRSASSAPVAPTAPAATPAASSQTQPAPVAPAAPEVSQAHPNVPQAYKDEVFDEWRKRSEQRELEAQGNPDAQRDVDPSEKPYWVSFTEAWIAKGKTSRAEDLISRYDSLTKQEVAELQKLIGLRGRDVDGRRGPITKASVDAYKESLATASALSKVKNFPALYAPSETPETQQTVSEDRIVPSTPSTPSAPSAPSEDGTVKIDLANKGFSSAAPEGRLSDIDLPEREYTHDDQLQNYDERVWRYSPRGGVLGTTGSSEETFTPATPLNWDASTLDDNQVKAVLWRMRSDIGPAAGDVLTATSVSQRETVTQLVRERLQRAIDSVPHPVPVNPLAAFKGGALDYGELAKEQNRYRKELAEYNANVIKAQQEALAGVIGSEEARSALDISRDGNRRAESANKREAGKYTRERALADNLVDRGVTDAVLPDEAVKTILNYHIPVLNGLKAGLNGNSVQDGFRAAESITRIMAGPGNPPNPELFIQNLGLLGVMPGADIAKLKLALDPKTLTELGASLKAGAAVGFINQLLSRLGIAFDYNTVKVVDERGKETIREYLIEASRSARLGGMSSSYLSNNYSAGGDSTSGQSSSTSRPATETPREETRQERHNRLLKEAIRRVKEDEELERGIR